MAGRIYAGIGGWTFPPWRGVFYPDGLPQKQELAFASRAVTSIEINGTYYSTFSRDSWKRWRDETPDGFVFAVKASRFATNRKKLAEAGPSIEKYLDQGLAELGPKLGPINWQLAATKKFDADDMAAFLALLPREHEGVKLRHAIEARHESFAAPAFAALAKKHKVAIVHAEGEDYPLISAATAPFTYARIMTARETLKQGVPDAELAELAQKAAQWTKRGDAFVYFISAAKERNPAAAQAFIKRIG